LDVLNVVPLYAFYTNVYKKKYFALTPC